MIATMLAKIPVPFVGSISGLVWVLILSVILTHIGFLDEDSMNKCNSYGIVMFAPMIVGGFVTVTITSVMIAGVFANML